VANPRPGYSLGWGGNPEPRRTRSPGPTHTRTVAKVCLGLDLVPTSWATPVG